MSAAAAGRTAVPVQVPPALAEGELREQALAELVAALRAEAHEYANKIFTVSGLLALEMTDAAEGLLSDFAVEHVGGGATLLEAIDSAPLVGLLVAKRAAGRLQGVRVRIDEQSCLEELPPALTEIDAISLLGNFIDNALEAVDSLPEGRRLVEVGIYQEQRRTRFRVADHGAGLDPSVRGRACQRGYTSKPDHHGLGLAIVDSVLERSNGDLDVRFSPAGTVVEARFEAGETQERARRGARGEDRQL